MAPLGLVLFDDGRADTVGADVGSHRDAVAAITEAIREMTANGASSLRPSATRIERAGRPGP